MDSLLGSVIWRFFKWLPNFILRRIFSADWMIKNIYIDIRPRHKSVEIIQPDNPRVTIYLEVRNSTHFNVEIDRILLDFVYGGEISNPQHLKRERLKPGETKAIFIKGNIPYAQMKNLAFHHKNNSNYCSLGIIAECNSSLHRFCIEKNLDGIKPEILNSHLLENQSNKP